MGRERRDTMTTAMVAIARATMSEDGSDRESQSADAHIREAEKAVHVANGVVSFLSSNSNKLIQQCRVQIFISSRAPMEFCQAMCPLA